MLPFIQTKKFPFSTRVYGRRVYVMDSEGPNVGFLQYEINLLVLESRDLWTAPKRQRKILLSLNKWLKRFAFKNKTADFR